MAAGGLPGTMDVVLALSSLPVRRGVAGQSSCTSASSFSFLPKSKGLYESFMGEKSVLKVNKSITQEKLNLI